MYLIRNFTVIFYNFQKAGSGDGFGAKGIGEPATIATAPAIANAIYDAIGVRVCDLPVTPEKILKALNGKRNRK